MLVPVLILFSVSCFAAAIYFTFLDGWYLLRLAIVYFRWRLAGPQTKALDESIRYSWVLPADLDWVGHMNNARYAREADFGRYIYMFRCGLLQTIWNRKLTTVLVASSLRFRRSLKLWEHFKIRTRLLGWDDHAFFLEQQFISCQDGFICAIMLARHHVTGISPSEVLQILYGRQVESPEIPEDVHCWLKSNQINRERLKNEVEKNSKSE
ncbi:protein THEM6-like [Ahaetulla prasina]|uniref:protein THEM6-like n=1 Tax=Ahaetulla prasina TaxID=499056 RepID=UPI00264A4874|nr:protein THEM6-like [Ahaetulla prasina]